MLVRSLPMKSRKGFARDVFETFNTHSCLILDVTDTNIKAQNGIFKNRREMECRTAVCLYYMSSLSTGPVVLLRIDSSFSLYIYKYL